MKRVLQARLHATVHGIIWMNRSPTAGPSAEPYTLGCRCSAMAAPAAFLALVLAAIVSQCVVAGMRQQTSAGLGAAAAASRGTPSAYPALRFRDDQTFHVLQVGLSIAAT